MVIAGHATTYRRTCCMFKPRNGVGLNCILSRYGLFLLAQTTPIAAVQDIKEERRNLLRL